MLLLLIGLASVLYLFNEFYWKRRNLPPGPTPLPLFGNLLEIRFKSNCYEAYRDWHKKYGPVHTYWFGTMPVIAISDYETIKETVIKDGEKYVDRWFFKPFNKDFRGGDYGVIFSEGALWRDQRRLTIHTLRDFGMGRNIMEERAMIEVEIMLERLAKNPKNVNMQSEFDIAVGSIINNILFGYRFDDEHLDEFDYLKKALRTFVTKGTDPRFIIANLSSLLRSTPGIKGIYKDLVNEGVCIKEFIKRQIAEKRRTIDYGNNESDDFVESYLKEWEKKKGTQQEEYFFEEQLVSVVFDVWTAGMETTSNTLTWAICYVLNDENVQDRIHAELDRVIGSDRKVTMADKNDLPYVNAVVSEAQRMANLLPQNLFRVTNEDVKIQGYHIPKGSVVCPQISCVLYDDKVFPEPYKFKPERFLNADGSYRKYEELVPFSVGKRQCAGEGLARLELYIFIANIFQTFKISSKNKPSTAKTIGQVVTALPYTCDFEPRQR